MVERIGGTPFGSGADDEELRKMRVKLDEAHFFFPPKEAALFAEMGRLMADHESARMMHARATTDERRSSTGDQAAQALDGMLKIYEALPKSLEKELGFEQLTRGTEADR